MHCRKLLRLGVGVLANRFPIYRVCESCTIDLSESEPAIA